MKHISLFSGQGGFDLAAEWMGWENIAHCEWNPFGQRILKYYWPNAKSYSDITTTSFLPHRGQCDILTGGFPCQPYSTAGKRLGKEDERHLWPHMLRAIREIRPRWVVGENVRGLISWNGGLVFDEVQADLEAEGYEVLPFLLPAVGVNAPHRRERIWFVAYSDGDGYDRAENGSEQSRCTQRESPEFSEKWKWFRDVVGRNVPAGDVTDASGTRRTKLNLSTVTNWSGFSTRLDNEGIPDFRRFPTQWPICSGNDGVSTGLDGITFSSWNRSSLKSAGNAIVPQVALQIFKAIDQYENLILQ